MTIYIYNNLTIYLNVFRHLVVSDILRAWQDGC